MTAAAGIPSALCEALAGRYTIERELGEGGMATVYLAQDQRHERSVALKVLSAEQSAALGPERFEREIKLLARLRHPFVLPLHDSGEAAGSLGTRDCRHWLRAVGTPCGLERTTPIAPLGTVRFLLTCTPVFARPGTGPPFPPSRPHECGALPLPSPA